MEKQQQQQQQQHSKKIEDRKAKRRGPVTPPLKKSAVDGFYQTHLTNGNPELSESPSLNLQQTQNVSSELWCILLGMCERNLAETVGLPPYIKFSGTEIYLNMKEMMTRILNDWKTQHQKSLDGEKIHYDIRLEIHSENPDSVYLAGKDVNLLPKDIQHKLFIISKMGDLMLTMSHIHESAKRSQFEFVSQFLGIDLWNVIDYHPNSPSSKKGDIICRILLGKHIPNIFSLPGLFDTNPFDVFPGITKTPAWLKLHCQQSIQPVIPSNQILIAGLNVALHRFDENACMYWNSNFQTDQDNTKSSIESESRKDITDEPQEIPPINPKFNYLNFFVGALWQIIDQNTKFQAISQNISNPHVLSDPFYLRNPITFKELPKDIPKTEESFTGFPKKWQNILRLGGGWSHQRQLPDFIETEQMIKDCNEPTLLVAFLHLMFLQEYIGEMINLRADLEARISNFWCDKGVSLEYQKKLTESRRSNNFHRDNYLRSFKEQCQAVLETIPPGTNQEEIFKAKRCKQYIQDIHSLQTIMFKSNPDLFRIEEEEEEEEDVRCEGNSGSVLQKIIDQAENYQMDLKSEFMGEINLDEFYGCLFQGYKKALKDIRGSDFLKDFQEILQEHQQKVEKSLSNYMFVIAALHSHCQKPTKATNVTALIIENLKSLAFVKRRERFCLITKFSDSVGKRIEYNTSEWVLKIVESTHIGTENINSLFTHYLQDSKGPLPTENFISRHIYPNEVSYRFDSCWNRQKHELHHSNCPSFRSVEEFNNYILHIKKIFESAKSVKSVGFRGSILPFSLEAITQCNLTYSDNGQSLHKTIETLLDIFTNENEEINENENPLIDVDNKSENEIETETETEFESDINPDISTISTTPEHNVKIDTLLLEGCSIKEYRRSLLFNLSGITSRKLSSFYSESLLQRVMDPKFYKSKGAITSVSELDLLLVYFMDKIKKNSVKEKIHYCDPVPMEPVDFYPGRNLSINQENGNLTYDGKDIEVSKDGVPNTDFLASDLWIQVKSAFAKDSYMFKEPIAFNWIFQFMSWMLQGEQRDLTNSLLKSSVFYEEFSKTTPTPSSNETTESGIESEFKPESEKRRSMFTNEAFNIAIKDNFFEWGCRRGELIIHGKWKLKEFIYHIFKDMFQALSETSEIWDCQVTDNQKFWESLQISWFKQKCWDIMMLGRFKEGNNLSWTKIKTEIYPELTLESNEPTNGEKDKGKEKDKSEENFTFSVETVKLTPDGQFQTPEGEARNPMESEEHLDTFLEKKWKKETKGKSSLLEFYILHYTLNQLPSVNRIREVCVESGLKF